MALRSVQCPGVLACQELALMGQFHGTEEHKPLWPPLWCPLGSNHKNGATRCKHQGTGHA